MGKKMLIDAAHPEETRVVVVKDKRVEEFDFESSQKTQIRGNIYLAKVTRIEPSLQAAFVDYGGNRHGFLAFNEIHPDYYQIPVADREELLKAEAEATRALAQEEDRDNGAQEAVTNSDEPDDDTLPEETVEASADDGETPADEANQDAETENFSATAEDASDDNEPQAAAEPDDAESGDNTVEEIQNGSNGDDEDDEDTLAEARRLRRQKLRNYKIQEVIKRRQVILVQAVKEERGNKGAALTTYLSLAGRYCVLMPNTSRGGGISRKITNIADRKRLRKIVESLEVPDGMGLIIRTAGAKRNKTEIKRDCEYLLRVWETVRSLTLESIAPALVYEEGNLVKRSIRDLYSKDIDEVLVEGEEAYKEAKGFMRMLTPSHAKNVQRYKDKYSIFQKYNVEPQLDAMFHPEVQLRSGGYLVINPTEALVSIDVNSGRATKERSIEHTALQTNLEAAEEVARQCRLRDLAGLLVIDFIDMEEHRNNRAVEKRLKDCLKQDRARVQVGRISNFGLLEMSRQRMRSGVLEGSTHQCETCSGSGVIRSTESTSLRILRGLEEYGQEDGTDALTCRVSVETALYLLNNKRTTLQEIEQRCGMRVVIDADSSLTGPQYEIRKGAAHEVSEPLPRKAPPLPEPSEFRDTAPDESGDGEGKGKRRRRRRGRKQEKPETTEAATTENETESTPETDENGEPKRRRRRGKRGGRRHSRRKSEEETLEQNASANGEDAKGKPTDVAAAAGDEVPAQSEQTEIAISEPTEPIPPAQPKDVEVAPTQLSFEAEPETRQEDAQAEAPAPTPVIADEPQESIRAESNGNGHAIEADSTPQSDEQDDEPDVEEGPSVAEEKPQPRRESSKKGWWQKRILG